MSADGSHTLVWGDGERTFRLRLRELQELEDKRNAGSFEIWRRLADGSFRVDDVFQVLRLGLIGGGVNPQLAHGLTTKYVTPGNLIPDNQIAARDVLGEALWGAKGDIVGKALRGMTEALEELSGSSSPASSETEPHSDGPPSKPSTVASGNSLPQSTAGTGVMGLTTNGAASL